MVLIFDLDDTLYEERTFVLSGLKAVSRFGHDRFGWNPETSFNFMINIFNNYGRGTIFDRWLSYHGTWSKSLVNECIKCYRYHTPNIELNSTAKKILPLLKETPLYLVTDGHKVVQANKVDALGLEAFFKRIMITHRFGLKHAKPSIYCFEKIKASENCSWSDMVYIGDNPAKDFINLNPLGVHTIRVLTGEYSKVIGKSGYEAQYQIQALDELLVALDHLKDQ
ncbi:putative hydrolase of the HAD superfamily [Desulfobotulus alkaliphilus]|uniref:Putative hydrolase of the HAD superfamily n=1 Tax=Desulfobotulus alkaliphilus TaxID=622671 RepID=A0A562RTH7_9BACT|nr:HAD hydrolase-like protein [Desulfobotulus alkaliphilus]TWI72372.1 putative hydrolase of the HAD superfamily [Desulfobotulus alkaliphilus]